jgi:outer membrane protein assembly factor BamD
LHGGPPGGRSSLDRGRRAALKDDGGRTGDVVREGFPELRTGARPLGAVGRLGLALAGCDTLSSMNPFDKAEVYKPEIVPEVPAEQIYNQGLARLQKSDYEGAAKKFEDLDKQYPYSEWSRKALIMTAYSHYEGQAWEDAITASKRYLQLHPSSKDAAYAQYLMAVSTTTRSRT